MIKPIPFLLHPAGKNYLWGGNRLRTLFNKQIPLQPLAETWECSTHPDGCSTIASGIHTGQLLSEILQQHPDYLGKYANAKGNLPVLIKLIDAEKNLSVQVHPDDAYAKRYENEQNGKTEMWYILDAKAGASLIYGFSKPIHPMQLNSYLENGTIEDCLQKIPVQKGDVFLIPAGTVHAIGAGIVLAEIQQSSNLTYRLYDYQRTDAQGNKRPLHIEKAKAVMQISTAPPPQTKQPVMQKNGYRQQCLCNCPYFCTTLLTIQTTCDLHDVFPNQNVFQVLLCIDGNGILQSVGNTLSFQKGDCLFLPANCADSKLNGNAALLHIVC